MHAIETEHLTKRYLLGQGQATTLREAIAGRSGRATPREILSLDDVSLAVEQGEAVAVIGANGAGKTTLLRILARITEPTSGVSRTRGRVAALLEVGAGFHPELTGRENAYLAGALYGLRRREVATRLDAIVAFAGVAPLLDTPVKRYSSGQYLRLAFAVAAHLEPDILLIDEVLAVGDAEFQQRCLGALRAAGEGGRTVVFVSHDLDAVSHLCRRVVWLHEGRVRADGASAATIGAYLDAVAASTAARTFEDDATRPVALLAARVGSAGGTGGALRREAPLELAIEYAVHEPVPALNVALFLTRADGVRVIDEAWRPGLQATETAAPGRYRATLTVPPILHTGTYVLGAWVGTAYDDLVDEEAVLTFTLEGLVGHRASRVVNLGAVLEIAPL